MVGVFGDIHGCYYTLLQLYKLVRDKYGDIQLYASGDLVDRGNHPVEVIEFIMSENVKPVLGNHECMFYYSFEFPNHPYRDVWASNGNFKTLNSYSEHPELLQKHITYFKNLPLFYRLPDCFISHAGISVLLQPKMHNTSQWNEADWEEFINNHMSEEIGVIWNRTSLMNCGFLQVVGHTKHRSAYFDQKTMALYSDTGAYTGNKLSCVIVDKNTHVDTLSFPTVPKDILFSRA
ncbi:MAG: serine/threonine protein phosphatase [Ignavibacteriales bacterium]|nr:serine/threonine protein phosphatase [Ignavibacteriales bacterium]